MSTDELQVSGNSAAAAADNAINQESNDNWCKGNISRHCRRSHHMQPARYALASFKWRVIQPRRMQRLAAHRKAAATSVAAASKRSLHPKELPKAIAVPRKRVDSMAIRGLSHSFLMHRMHNIIIEHIANSGEPTARPSATSTGGLVDWWPHSIRNHRRHITFEQWLADKNKVAQQLARQQRREERRRYLANVRRQEMSQQCYEDWLISKMEQQTQRQILSSNHRHHRRRRCSAEVQRHVAQWQQAKIEEDEKRRECRRRAEEQRNKELEHRRRMSKAAFELWLEQRKIQSSSGRQHQHHLRREESQSSLERFRYELDDRSTDYYRGASSTSTFAAAAASTSLGSRRHRIGQRQRQKERQRQYIFK